MTNWPHRTYEILQQLREKQPMVHHLTNDVVTNLTANITLCLGAAPVMAPARSEVEQMVGFAGALVLNIGTLNEPLIESMIAAGRKANELDIPVVLDPVGAGATTLRTDSALQILDRVKLTVLRGNAGELLTLAGAGGKVRGVDSMQGIEGQTQAVAEFAKAQGCVMAVTGPVDLITDGEQTLRVKNGHALMGRVTGTGCGATTAIACFVAAAKEAPLEATTAALAAYGFAAEQAAQVAKGPGTFVPHFLDGLANLEESPLVGGVKIAEQA
jgi:hydroxyethylthiazole kinase